MGSNRNIVELKWAKIGMENENQNELFTLAMEIKIKMRCIVIDMFTLSCN